MPSIPSNGTFKPVKRPGAPQVVKGQTEEGHELLRMIVLLLREQIRLEFYATRETLNWTQVAQHLNMNFAPAPQSDVLSPRSKNKEAISDDLLREIEKNRFRDRRIETLEVFGAAFASPLDGSSLSPYQMLAILRSDADFYPDLDRLKKEVSALLNISEPINGVQELAKLVIATRELRGWEPRDLVDYLNEFLGLPGHFSESLVDELEAQIEKPGNFNIPIDFLSTLQSAQIVKDKSGRVYKKNELFLIVNGKLNPN